METPKSEFKKSGGILFFTLVMCFTAFFVFNKRPNLFDSTTHADSISESKKNSPPIRASISREIEKPVFLNKNIIHQQNEQFGKEMANCLANDNFSSISEKSLTEVLSNIDDASPGVRNCLIDLGVSKNCLESIKSKECRLQILKSRANLIDRLSAGQNNNNTNFSHSILANQLISRIFSENSAQESESIFQISDKLLSDFSDNESLHNIRGLFGVLSFSRSENPDILEKGDASANRLIETGDREKMKKGLMIKYSYKMVEFYKNRDPNSLVDAEMVAKKFLEMFSQDPTGSYMMVQVSGFRGDCLKTLEWLNRGLSFGSSQPFYNDYMSVKTIVEGGNLNPDILGVRMDYNEQFQPESLIIEAE